MSLTSCGLDLNKKNSDSDDDNSSSKITSADNDDSSGKTHEGHAENLTGNHNSAVTDTTVPEIEISTATEPEVTEAATAESAASDSVMLSELTSNSFYRYENHEDLGEIVWVYDFHWHDDEGYGVFNTYAYYINYTPVYCMDYNNREKVVGMDGRFETPSGGKTVMSLGSGYNISGINSVHNEFSLFRNSDGNYTDSDANMYFKGTPWDNLPADYATPQLICRQNENDWAFWVDYDSGADAEAYITDNRYQDELATYVYAPGSDPWSVQAKYENFALEKGSKYRVSFDYSIDFSDSRRIDRNYTTFVLQHNGEPYDTYCEGELKLYNGEVYNHAEITFIMMENTDNNVFCGFNFGAIGSDISAHIANFCVEKLS